MSERASILLLGGEACAPLSELLAPHYQILQAETYAQAESVLSRASVQAVLLDAALFAQHGCLPAADVPVLAFGAENDPATADRLLEAGVADLISRPFHGALLLRRIRNAAALYAPHRGSLSPDLLSALMGLAQNFQNDENLTLLGSCDALCALTGFSPEEIRTRFGNHLMELVPPAARQEFLQQFRTQTELTPGVELPLLRKDGQTAWALIKAYPVQGRDAAYFQSILLDITQSKQTQEGLRLSLERHQIILSQANDIVFELDFLTDTLLCSPKWEERFGYAPVTRNALDLIACSPNIYPDDHAKLLECIKQLQQGERYLEAEIRIANAAGQYSWSRLRATAQQDQNGNTLKLVGVIIDIDQEKRASQALLDKADRDSLTKLYNKTASRRHVEAYLSARPAPEQAALLIIDLDNFKRVNDRYGHMYGDAILIQAATEICSYFRGDDIISRIGGDEFMVFMKNVPNRQLVEKRCQQLICAIHQLYHEQLADCNLSCSIGAALIPEHGTSFQELFQRADRALYSAKVQKKGCFVFYDMQNRASFPVYEPTPSEIPPQPVFTSDTPLIRYVFNQLYESGNVEDTIQSILELAGRQINADRAYIFENTADGQFCSNTFEWCNSGIEPQMHQLQNISYQEDLQDQYYENFNEHGIFYCPDIHILPPPLEAMLNQQSIKSMLQCAIRDNGIFSGFVGFDQCSSPRLWTQEQIDLLTTLSQILSLFLLKKRAQDRAMT